MELTFSDSEIRVESVADGARRCWTAGTRRRIWCWPTSSCPGPTGYEICRTIKASERPVPVVLLAGTFEPFDPELERRDEPAVPTAIWSSRSSPDAAGQGRRASASRRRAAGKWQEAARDRHRQVSTPETAAARREGSPFGARPSLRNGALRSLSRARRGGGPPCDRRLSATTSCARSRARSSREWPRRSSASESGSWSRKRRTEPRTSAGPRGTADEHRQGIPTARRRGALGKVERWEEAGSVHARTPSPGSRAFCMVIPPPNVTGNLHIGHVLVYTLHDIVARWRRMQGATCCGCPERITRESRPRWWSSASSAARGHSRHELGREAFERAGLGVEGDLRREDHRCACGARLVGATGPRAVHPRRGLSRAVRTVFVRLYDEGLIYRDRYIVNWCPGCHTAISDLETVHEEVEGKLYTIRYPAAEGEGDGDRRRHDAPRDDARRHRRRRASRMTSATTGARRRARCAVPLTDRKVPVVADDFVDPDSAPAR